MSSASAFETLRAHAKVLRDGQAPHQQGLAEAIEQALKSAEADAVTSYSERNAQLSDQLTDVTAQISSLTDNAARLIAERDAAVGARSEIAKQAADLSRQIEGLLEKTGDRDNLEVRVVELEGKLAQAEDTIVKLQAELNGKTGTGIATTAGETLADIKAGLGAAKTVGEPTA